MIRCNFINTVLTTFCLDMMEYDQDHRPEESRSSLRQEGERVTVQELDLNVNAPELQEPNQGNFLLSSLHQIIKFCNIEKTGNQCHGIRLNYLH